MEEIIYRNYFTYSASALCALWILIGLNFLLILRDFMPWPVHIDSFGPWQTTPSSPVLHLAFATALLGICLIVERYSCIAQVSINQLLMCFDKLFATVCFLLAIINFFRALRAFHVF